MSILDDALRAAYHGDVRRIYDAIAADDVALGMKYLLQQPPSPDATEWLPLVGQEIPPPDGGAPPKFYPGGDGDPQTRITFTRRTTGIEFAAPSEENAAALADVVHTIGERHRAALFDSYVNLIGGAGRAAPHPAPAPVAEMRIELQIGRWLPRLHRRRPRFSVQNLYRRYVWCILRPAGPAAQVLADLVLEPGERYRIVRWDAGGLLAPAWDFVAISPTHLLALGDWMRPTTSYQDIVRMVEELHTRTVARPADPP